MAIFIRSPSWYIDLMNADLLVDWQWALIISLLKYNSMFYSSHLFYRTFLLWEYLQISLFPDTYVFQNANAKTIAIFLNEVTLFSFLFSNILLFFLPLSGRFCFHGIIAFSWWEIIKKMNKNNAKNWRYIIGFHVILCSTYTSSGEVYFSVEFFNIFNKCFQYSAFLLSIYIRKIRFYRNFLPDGTTFLLINLNSTFADLRFDIRNMFLSLFLNCQCDIDKTFRLILLYQYLILSFFIVLSSLFIFLQFSTFSLISH